MRRSKLIFGKLLNPWAMPKDRAIRLPACRFLSRSHFDKSVFCSIVFTIWIFSCQSTTKIHDLDWLQGSWRMDENRGIESWKFIHDTLIGNVFSNRDRKYTETLKIYKKVNHIVYEATVFNQNGGNPVIFELASIVHDSLHFVNKNHDFPNYIDYKKVSDTKIHCHVYGDKGDGFDYALEKVKIQK